MNNLEEMDLEEKEKQLALTEAIHALLVVDGNSERCGHALCTVLAYLCPNEKALESVRESLNYYYKRIQDVKAAGEVGETLFDIGVKGSS